MYKWWQTKRKETKRKIRLHTKAQKLGVIDKLPEINSLPSFNKQKNRLSSLAHCV